MDIGDVRHLFESFAAGTATAEELHEAVANGVAAAPDLAESYIALVCSFAWRGSIDDALRASLINLIDEIGSSGITFAGRRTGAVSSAVLPVLSKEDAWIAGLGRRATAPPAVAAPLGPPPGEAGPAQTRGDGDRSAVDRSNPRRDEIWSDPAAVVPDATVEPAEHDAAPGPWAEASVPLDSGARTGGELAEKDGAARLSGRARLMAVGVLVLAAAVAAAFVGPQLWDTFQARRLVADVIEADAASFDARYQELVTARATPRQLALADERLRTRLISHFRDETDALVEPPALDFGRARTRLQELGRLLPGSSLVADLVQRLNQRAKAQVTSELALRDRLLKQGRLIATDGGLSVAIVQQSIRRIDPSNEAVADPLVAGAFAAAARSALEGGHDEEARALIDAGLEFAGRDARLRSLKESAARELRSRENVRRAAELEQRLATLDPVAPDFLEEVLAHRDDLIALAATGSAGPGAKRLSAALEPAVAIRLRQQLAEGDVAAAQQLLMNVGELLPKASLTALRAIVLDGARAQEERALETLDKLRHAILTGRLSQPGPSGAPSQYEELQKAGASPATLAEARDLLAYGYLRESRRARIAGDRSDASTKLLAGIALRPGSTTQAMLDSEQAVLEGGHPSGLAPDAVDLDATRGRFADALRARTLGFAELAAIAQSLDRLDSIGASAQEVAAGLGQVEDRMVAELARLYRESPDQAQLLARQASAALPASERLADEARRLRDAGPGTVAAAPPVDIGALRREIDATLARPEPTERWAAGLKSRLQKLGALVGPNDATLVEARRVTTATFAAAATRARSQKRYEDANRLLRLADSIAAAAAAPADERGTIERASSNSESAAAVPLNRASADGVKQRLADQAEAGDVAGALATASALRRAMAGSPNLQRDVPQALVAAYLHKARNEIIAGTVDAALKTLAEGRQKFGASPELRSLELRYMVVGDAYDRLSTAVTLNVAAQSRYLATLRKSEGADFVPIERMLAQTLANRIADEKAADRTAVAAELLVAGRRLFAEHAALLELGRAGVLPDTPIAVSSGEVRP